MIDNWIIQIIAIVIFILLVRNKKRGCFWIDKEGNKLSFKQFLKRWGSGVQGITPLQQTKTSLLGFPLIYGGTLTGIVIMLLRREWWLVLILIGGLPVVTMQLVSLIQKYITQKKIQDTMKELENERM